MAGGWLHTEKAIPREALRDERLMRTLLSSALTILGQSDRPLLRLRWMLLGGTDPNDARLIRENAEGVCYTPLSTHHHRRIGARERVLDVARRYRSACASSCTPWPRGCCSTTATERSASSI
jgi:hypothetical protein